MWNTARRCCNAAVIRKVGEQQAVLFDHLLVEGGSRQRRFQRHLDSINIVRQRKIHGAPEHVLALGVGAENEAATMAMPWSWIFLIASLKFLVLGRRFTGLCMAVSEPASIDSKPINRAGSRSRGQF